jgi:hypothetical protein
VVWHFFAKTLQTFKGQKGVLFNSLETEISGYDNSLCIIRGCSLETK